MPGRTTTPIWIVTVDFADDRHRMTATVAASLLSDAVENALVELDLFREKSGSYQITVTSA